MTKPTTYSRDEIIKLLSGRVTLRPIDSLEDLKSVASELGLPILPGRPGDLVWYWSSQRLPGVAFAYAYALLMFVGGTVQNAHVGPSNPPVYGEFIMIGDTPVLKEKSGRQWQLLNGTEIP